MKLFLYYFNYSVINTQTKKFNLSKFKNIRFWRLFCIDQSNVSTTANQNSLAVMTDFIHHFFKIEVRILQFCFDFFIFKVYNISVALIHSSRELKIAQLLNIIIYRSFNVKN